MVWGWRATLVRNTLGETAASERSDGVGAVTAPGGCRSGEWDLAEWRSGHGV